jgi:hypothetical protein
MSKNQRNRVKADAREAEPKIITTSQLFSDSTTGKSEMERLNLIKGRLLTMLVGLERKEPISLDAETQALRIQEEISLLVWMVEDWQIQIATRN